MKAAWKFWRNESGASAALYALALPALVGMVGIGFDYARVASMDTELQNAADQAALAGATQLDQIAGAVDRATAAAQNGLATNQTLSSNDEGGTTIDIPDGQVYFYTNLADAEAGTNAIDPAGANADAEARFIRVKVETRRANYALTPVVGAFYGDISAEAVAGIGSAVCRIPPLMMCNPDEPLNNTDPNVDFIANNHVGQGLLVVQQGKWDPGAFGFLDLGNGATGVERALAWTSFTGQCVPVNGPEVIDAEIEPGLKASTQDAINTRFDLYDNCPAGGSCPSSINAIKDVTHISSTTGVPNFSNANKSCTYGTNGQDEGWKEPVNRYLPTANAPLATSVTPTAMGHPRDICHATDPRSCTRFGDGFWDRDAYFRSRYGWNHDEWLEYTKLSLGGTDANRPSRPSRYDVYKWELKNRGNANPKGGPDILGNHVVGSRTNYGTPICSPNKGYGAGWDPEDDDADRRRMSVAVINCHAEDVKGKSGPYRVRRFVDVFLVEPSLNRQRTSKTDIYIEIIGESDASGVGETEGTVIRRDVPFLVK